MTRPAEPVGNDAEIAAEAATWVARHRLGTLDDAAFQAWRDRDVGHAIAFARALALWETAARTAPPAARTRARRVSGRTILHAATAVLAVVGVGVAATCAYAWDSAATAVGGNRTIRLPDGSTAALNTDTRLSWRISGTERTFWIERGEVALNLVRGPAATLHGDARSAILSPGRFDIRTRGEALDILVQQGRAAVDGRPSSAVDARGGTASMLISSGAATVRPADAGQVDRITAWQRREILFRDATLGSAVEDYNRFLVRKIVIVDRELASIPVGGRFVTTDPAAFLNAVSTGLDIRVSHSPTAWLLTR